MARPAPFTARINATLDLDTIEIKLDSVRPPVVTLKGRAHTPNSPMGRYSAATLVLHHLPPTALRFIEDMKATLAGKQQEKEPG